MRGKHSEPLFIGFLFGRGAGGHSALFQPDTQGLTADPVTPLDPTHAWSFPISPDNARLLFLCIAFAGFEYTVGAIGFTVILGVTARIFAVFDNVFALTFAASGYFSFQ